jgi:hypothetical protein
VATRRGVRGVSVAIVRRIVVASPRLTDAVKPVVARKRSLQEGEDVDNIYINKV